MRHDQMRRRLSSDVAIAIFAGLVASGVAAADGDLPTASFVTDEIESLSRALESQPGMCSFGQDDFLFPVESLMNDHAANLTSTFDLLIPTTPPPPE